MAIDLAAAPPAPAGGASPAPAGRRNAASAGRGARVRQPFGHISGPTLGVLVIWMSLLVLLPLTAVVGKAFSSGGGAFWSAISNREVRDALILTVGLAVGVAVVNAVMGTLIAWVLVRDRFFGRSAIDAIIDLPLVLPTIVAGIVLLALYGTQSPIHLDLAYRRLGVGLALLFVTMPFVVRTVQPVLGELDRDMEQAAASLGAGPWLTFRRVVLPNIAPAIAAGAALAFTRAIAEFGATVLISGNIPLKTQVASVQIYGQIESDNTAAAAAVSTVLLGVALVVLLLMSLVQRWAGRRG
jgi:sulfate transport system permease protein